MDMGYRIGAVAKLTGISTDTIRAWERRYGVVEPDRGENNNRYYSERQVRKLINVKRLVDAGQAISTICQLSDDELRDRTSGLLGVSRLMPSGAGRWTIFSIQKPGWLKACIGAQPGIEVSWCSELDALPTDDAELLVVDMPSLSESSAALLTQTLDRDAASRCVVIYRFAAREQLRALASRGYRLLKGPLEPFALVNLLGSTDSTQRDRQFTQDELDEIVAMKGHISCECPRHLSELIVSLNQFEDYSQSCISTDEEDALLHRRLHDLAVEARFIMERALMEVVSTDGHTLN